MVVSVDDVKNVLYLDGTADNKLIQGYLNAANRFIMGAVGSDDSFYQQKDVQPLFDIAVKSLAATYYQYRLSLSDIQTYPIDLTVNSIIGQLRGMFALKEGDDDENDSQSTQSSN